MTTVGYRHTFPYMYNSAYSLDHGHSNKVRNLLINNNEEITWTMPLSQQNVYSLPWISVPK